MVETSARLIGVTSLMLGVTDMQRSVSFYRDTLGLPVQHAEGGLALLRCGAVTLGLNLGLGRMRPQLAGAAEVVFSVDDVRAAHEVLRERGVRFVNEPRNVTGTHWACTFTDPDGHLLSVFGPETASAT